MERLIRAVGRDGLRRVIASDLSIRIISVLGMIALAYTLAELTWRIAPQPKTMIRDAPVATSQPRFGSSRPDHVDDTTEQRTLFGKPQKTTIETPKTRRDIPETRLNLKLTGILASDKKSDSRAIISVDAGKERFYAINEKLSGSAKLANILEDHVLIDRNGRHETLRLSKKRAVIKSTPNAQPSTVRPVGEQGKTTLREYRDRSLSNPSSLSDLGQVRPVNREGKMIGVRLVPKTDRSLLRRHGVQRNDIITAVNGIELNSQLKALEVMRSIQSSERIELTLLRGNEALNLALDLDK